MQKFGPNLELTRLIYSIAFLAIVCSSVAKGGGGVHRGGGVDGRGWQQWVEGQQRGEGVNSGGVLNL